MSRSITRTPLLAVSSCLAAAALLLAACEYYPTDAGGSILEPPSLSGFGVTPDSIDVSREAADIRVAVAVRSPGGADSTVIELSSPSGAEVISCTAREPQSGSRESGLWACELSIDRAHEAGVWHTSQVVVHHGDGEVLLVPGEDLRRASFSTGVQVVSAILPTVTIVSPEHESTFTFGRLVYFAGRAVDGEGREIPGSSLVWTSSLDGELETAAEFESVDLSIGRHTIALTATDEEGLRGSAQIAITIQPSNEVASIVLYPDAGSDLYVGDSFHVLATAFNERGEEIPGVVFDWSSSLPSMVSVDADGLVTALAEGDELATITVSVGEVSRSIQIRVLAREAPVDPTVKIVSPEWGDQFTLGDTVYFAAEVKGDVNVNPGSGAVVWSSSRDGRIGSGTNFSSDALTAGSHQIVATVTDIRDVMAADTMYIDVLSGLEVNFILIDPSAGGMMNPGLSLQFRARAFGRYENLIPDVTFTWTSDDERIATVDQNGLVTARAFGVTKIRAEAAGITEEADVAIGTPDVEILSPDFSAEVEVNRPITFQGRGTGVDGATLSHWQLNWWSSLDGHLGSGESLTTSSLSQGIHTITLTARDRFDLEASDSSRTVRVIPQAPNIEYSQVSVGSYHSCGLTTFGIAFCWGRNRNGELGQGNTAEQLTPARVQMSGQYTSIAVGDGHTIALGRDGRVFAWGHNAYGQLGNGTVVSSSLPVLVDTEERFVAIDTRGVHNVALTADGRAFSWGGNFAGRLGDGTTVNRLTPVAVAGGHVFASVSAGYRNTMALTSSGDVYGWGQNDGVFGDGVTAPEQHVPALLMSGYGFVKLSTNISHTLALTASGEAFAWGDNSHGRLGDGTTTRRGAPVPVAGGHRFQEIHTGGGFSVGLTLTGRALSWGANFGSELGIGDVGGGEGSYTARFTPSPVVGGYIFTTLGAGGSTTLGRTSDGRLYGWGSNYSGELGDGTTTTRNSPTQVFDPR